MSASDDEYFEINIIQLQGVFMQKMDITGLKFIFTKDSFMPDITENMPASLRDRARSWLGDGGYDGLYELGSGPRPQIGRASCRERG